MILVSVVMLLIMGAVAIFVSYSLAGGFIQIFLIITLLVFGINLIQGRRFFYWFSFK